MSYDFVEGRLYSLDMIMYKDSAHYNLIAKYIGPVRNSISDSEYNFLVISDTDQDPKTRFDSGVSVYLSADYIMRVTEM